MSHASSLTCHLIHLLNSPTRHVRVSSPQVEKAALKSSEEDAFASHLDEAAKAAAAAAKAAAAAAKAAEAAKVEDPNVLPLPPNDQVCASRHRPS